MSNRPHVAAAAFIAAFALLPAAPAQAADVTVTDAKIAGGKLVVTGTTTTPNTWVRLDGQTARDFNVKSGADGVFAFGVVYHPGDCIVDLQKLVSPTALGAASAALVADCGPAGVSPRGAWNPTAAYVANDLVTYLGSTWRARRGNANTLPVSGVDWEQFAAAGEPAPDGSTGGAENEAAADGVSPRADTPIGPAGGDLTGNYPNPQIAAGVITSGHLSAGAVTLTKLADGAVTLTKLALDSVNTYRIIDGAVATADLALNSVNSARVIDESLTAADLASSSVGSSEIATDAVAATEIANDSIDSGEIADNSLFAEDLASSSVGASELAADSVGNSELQNNAVSGANVTNESLTMADIDGANISGQVNLNNVANGRCVQVTFSVPGSQVGEAVLISTNGAIQNGIVLYGQRVSAAGLVEAAICNFTGVAMTPIVDLPVRIFTFN